MKKCAFIGTNENYLLLVGRCSKENVVWLDILRSYDDIVQEIQKQDYSCLLVKKHDNYIADQLLWECQCVREVKIVDSDNPYEIEIKRGKRSNKRLWDFLFVNGHSQIEEGGFYHCFNNEPYTEDEVREFADNVYLKLQDYLDSEKTVLEIGCSSGITMFRLLPYVKSYIGVDMASISIRRNKERIKERNIQNAEFFECEANKIADLPVKDLDIIIINSVIQYFSGINYLRNVILQAISLMKEEGILYIGDVIDLDKKEELVQSALLYKKTHPDAETRIDYSDELFLTRDYFMYLASQVDGIYKVEITDKIGNISNEMTDFRYDVILHYKRDSVKIENCSGKIQSAEKIL